MASQFRIIPTGERVHRKSQDDSRRKWNLLYITAKKLASDQIYAVTIDTCQRLGWQPKGEPSRALSPCRAGGSITVSRHTSIKDPRVRSLRIRVCNRFRFRMVTHPSGIRSLMERAISLGPAIPLNHTNQGLSLGGNNAEVRNSRVYYVQSYLIDGVLLE